MYAKEIRIAIVALAVTSIAAPAAAECRDVPKFIGMYGDWESYAFKAEPADILDEHPEWTVAHAIRGTAAEVCPGIRFTVEQAVGGETIQTLLTYVYDPERNKSYGVIASSSGARLRGILEHGPKDTDELTLMDFDGNVVWQETKIWTSDDEFESIGRFEYQGGEGRVWFRTYRVTASE